MSRIMYKEVEYWKYCPKCKYEDRTEREDPCNECLTDFFNYETEKPTKFKEKETN